MAKRDAGTIRLSIELYTQKFARSVAQTQKQFRTFGRGLDRDATRLRNAVALPFAALASGAVYSSVKFESAFAGIRKTVDASEKEFARLRKGVLELSKTMPTAATEIARVGEVAGQLGIKSKNLLSFTKVMIELSETTNLSSEEASFALAKFINVTNLSQDQARDLGNVIVDLGNNFATTEKDIVEMGQRMASVSKLSKFSAPDILAFATAASSVGLEAELSGSALQTLVIKIDKAIAAGNDKLESFARVAGQSAEDFKKAFQEDAGSALETFFRGLSNAQKSGQDLTAIISQLGFNEKRLIRFTASLTGGVDLLSEAQKRAAKEFVSGNALAAEYEKRLETLESQIKITWNQLKALAIEVGDALSPAIKFLNIEIRDLIKWFSSLGPRTKTFILTFGIAASAIIAVTAAVGSLAVLLGGGFVLTIGAAGAAVGAFIALLVAWKDDILNLFGNTLVEQLKNIEKTFVSATIRLQGLVSSISSGNIAAAILGTSGEAALIKKANQEIERRYELVKTLKAVHDSNSKSIQKNNEALDDFKQKIKNLTSVDDIKKKIQELTAAVKAGTIEADDAKTILAQLQGQLSAGATDFTNFTEGTKKASEALGKLQADLQRTAYEVERSNFDEAIQEQIELGSINGIQMLYEEFKSKAKAAFLDGMGDTLKDAGEQGRKLAEATFGEEWAREREASIDAAIEHEKEAQQKAYEEGISFWRSTFENAITGVKFNLEDMLKQVAVGFAAEIATQAFGSLGGILDSINSPQGLGSSLAQSLLGSDGLDLGGTISESLGLGAGGLLGSMGGGAGILLDTGEVIAASSAVPAGATAVGSAALPGSGLLGFAAANPYLAGGIAVAGLAAAAFGGGLFDSKPTNKETLARMDVFDKLNKKLDEISGLQFADANGIVKSLENFNPSNISTRFNKPNWTQDFFNDFGTDVGLTFTSLGEALTDIMGITEDVGSQIGAMLAEDLGGSVEGIVALMQSMGITVGQVEESFVKMGLTGEKSWHEVEVALQKANAAFAEGVAGVGQIDKAFKGLVTSGGRGAVALGSIKNTIIEAKEAGVTNFDALRDKLLETFEPDVVDAFFQSLSQRGLKSFDEILNASDRVLGGVVADMESIFIEMGSSFDIIGQTIRDATESLDRLQQAASQPIDVKINFTATADELSAAWLKTGGGGSINASVPQFGYGGFVSKPTLALVGDRGPEMILPTRPSNGYVQFDRSMLDSMSQNAGVGGGGGNVSINIDARGAEMGVEKRIEKKLKEILAGRNKLPGRNSL